MSCAHAPLLSEEEIYLFNTGQLFKAYMTFGAHPLLDKCMEGVRFVVWAPNAQEVRVAGSFNNWDGCRHPLAPVGTTGVWAGFIAGIGAGTSYKYELVDVHGKRRLKADPFAFQSELRPGTASIVTKLGEYHWNDADWETYKRNCNPYKRPMLIYEVHLGSWRMDGPEQFQTYGQLADELVDYTAEMGYTHIELLPITEHPLDESWGYQTTGYFAATSRYGPPSGLKMLIDRCHQRGIGVILDWVPGHFCKDDHGLRLFDGTPLFEDADMRRAEKPLWGTLAFDFGKAEVQSFLLSSALFWFDEFHVDGIRVDAVASMIDLQFDKPPHMHTRNRHGGTEHLEALDFLRKLNETVFRFYPHSLMFAEDSSAWPGVTKPTYLGGLGFQYKWNMGWMNDMLRYMETDPSERPAHHSLTTFSILYAHTENYVLPLSHDEVVHGKRSLLHKMPGSYAEKFANLRLLYGYWMTHPGKKLLFMGGEFGQFDEWNAGAELDWPLLKYPMHDSMRHYMREWNAVYLAEPALWETDHAPDGFQWIDADNAKQCVLSYIRRGNDAKHHVIALCNFSHTAFPRFRIGVPVRTVYRLMMNSNDSRYGGEGMPMPRRIKSARKPLHGQTCSLEIPLPALSFLLLRPDAPADKER